MRSIRWKIMLVSFLVVFLPIYFLNQYAVRSFDKFTRTALEEEMIGQAFMLAEQYRSTLPVTDERRAAQRKEDFATTLLKYSEQFQSRLQVLSPSGVVLFDSDPDSLVGADFSERPEIANAIRDGGYQAAWRLISNRKQVFYFVPLPIKHNGNIIGIAYVTRHTGQIAKAIDVLMSNQRMAMITALFFALLMSTILSLTMTTRLRTLTRASTAYAKGDAELDLHIGGWDEIADLGSAVENMATEIEKRNEYNRGFVSTVMHELKTPITAIKGAAEVLTGGAAEKPEARKKFLANITYEADRLARMVAELNELTKLDIETLRGHKERVDYCQCVRDIQERLMPTFDHQHATLNTSIPSDPLTAMIVPGRIEQVIANLIENAFRYTDVSGHVELTVSTQDQTVVTSIKDNGTGIPETSIQKVFDRFYTTERKDLPKDYGSGLGLSIAKSIVENHQGHIWVESSPNNGACFSFSLPLID